MFALLRAYHNKKMSSAELVGEFVPKKIVDAARIKGVLYVLVRWEDYSPQDDTWEPLAQFFEDRPDLVKEFCRKLKSSGSVDDVFLRAAIRNQCSVGKRLAVVESVSKDGAHKKKMKHCCRVKSSDSDGAEDDDDGNVLV